MTETTRTGHALEALELGREAGRARATWAIDGNTDAEHIRNLLRMLGDGDPEVDFWLAPPHLSEGDRGEANLFEEVTGMDAHAEASWAPDSYQALLRELCEAWEEGATEAYWPAVEAELHRWLA